MHEREPYDYEAGEALVLARTRLTTALQRAFSKEENGQDVSDCALILSIGKKVWLAIQLHEAQDEDEFEDKETKDVFEVKFYARSDADPIDDIREISSERLIVRGYLTDDDHILVHPNTDHEFLNARVLDSLAKHVEANL